MNLIDSITLRHFHKTCIKIAGAGTVDALGWQNQNSQQVRFGMLAGMSDMGGCSVLDAGCGHGDLCVYLHNKYPHVQYTGIDIMQEFLAVAGERCAHLPNTSFIHGDFFTTALPAVDYVLASGSLSYRNTKPRFVFRAITKLFATSRVAFGFNLLRSVKGGPGLIATYQPAAIMQHCHTLTTKVALHQGYFNDDFTVWMYH